MENGYRVVPVPVLPEPLLDGATCDYADCFEVRLDRPDTHSAEEWARACLDSAPAAARATIRLAHGGILRFDLRADDADHLMGWLVEQADREVLHLKTSGPLLGAHIIARRTSPTTCRMTTFLLYERPAARRLWVFVGPLHRAIAPLLLRRAAAVLVGTDDRRTAPSDQTG